MPDESYSVSNIQDHFKYILKKYETITDKPSIRICVSKIENRIKFKLKSGYYLNFLLFETMRLLWALKVT